MPKGKPAIFTAEPAGPLTPEEARRAEVSGERLRAELAALWHRIPRTPRSALALSRDLGIDRNICQKVLSALAPGVEAINVLERVPGVEGLRKFVGAASKAAGLNAPDPSASAAIDAFEDVLRELAGSQIRLVQRLRSNGIDDAASARSTESHHAREIEARRRLFQDAADVLGVTVDVLPTIALIRPVPGRPDCTEGARAYGLLGLKWDDGPLPFSSSSHASTHDSSADDAGSQVRFSPLAERFSEHHGLLPDFCSAPMPRITARNTRGLTVLTLDPAHNNAKVDLVFGHRWGTDKHPKLYEDPFLSQYVGIKRPTRRMVFDLYMHRSMAMASVPTVGAYRWWPELASDPLKHWHERLPGRVPLELLGPGLTAAASTAWGRHAELARFVFDELGWNPGEFVGFRCDAAYPVWNSAFYMTFDFRDAPANEDA